MSTETLSSQEWRTVADVRRQQDAGLVEVFRAARKSPFYAQRVGAGESGRDALRRQPLTTKDDLRASYPDGLLAVSREQVATYHESSGTSGQPTASWYTENDWRDLAERFARKWVGIDPGDTLMVRTPYSMMITGHLAHAGARLRGAVVVPADNRTPAMPYPRVVRALADLAVTLTWSMPTEPFLWAAACREAGLDPATDFPALRALFLGGEMVAPEKRRRLEELWGVSVVEEYGSTETGTLAGACPEGALHLWADRAVFEVYDRTTKTVADEGRGELVVTPLRREAMPLLRYNLADEVEIRHEPCPCGWALPVVRVLGRSDDVHTVESVPVSQRDLEGAVYSLPAEMGVLFWRARIREQHVDVEIEVEEAHRANACDALRALVSERLGVAVVIRGVSVGSLVPLELLTSAAALAKPRFLFGRDEDWTAAVHYQ